MFRYIAGNSIKHAIQTSKKILMENKIPIINFAIEETEDKKGIYYEHKNLIRKSSPDNKIAIKLSSFEFDMSLIEGLITLAQESNIQIIIDAEKNINYGEYNKISNELIQKYNRDKCNIVKTYQMYRKDSLPSLIQDYNTFTKKDIYLGIKMVRGAYWNSEHKEGHLYVKKQDTDNNYNKAIIFLSKNTYKTYTMLATHNKESINLALLLHNYYKRNSFEFAHLLGMREGVYNKIKKNNNVHVYIPYGPYREMIPYLLRRLYENLDTLKYFFR